MNLGVLVKVEGLVVFFRYSRYLILNFRFSFGGPITEDDGSSFYDIFLLFFRNGYLVCYVRMNVWILFGVC